VGRSANRRKPVNNQPRLGQRDQGIKSSVQDWTPFSFGFTALEYSSPSNISYKYYLEGWDKKWNYAKNIHNAIYTHLPEGSLCI
jgi:hypothetical protein